MDNMVEQKNAYVSIVCSQNYIVGLLATYLSLKQTGTQYPLYAMMPQRIVDECKHEIDVLRREGIRIIDYANSVELPDELLKNNAKQGDYRFSYTFDKLKIFELTQFDKIVFIDSDIYILQSLDRLFSMPHMSAMIAGKSYPGNEDWKDLTSGIMTIVPQEGLLKQFEAMIPQVIKEKPSCGDQDVLQAFYSEWSNHPELDMGEKYGVIAGYASYYEDHLGYYYSDDTKDDKSVAVLHFAGEKKPWMYNWGRLSVIKQELEFYWLRIRKIRNTRCVLLEYNKLVRKAKRILK